jgi:hypothetical protein
MKTFKNKVMSLGLAVVMMAIGLNFSGTEAQSNIRQGSISQDDERTKANFDGPFENICKEKGNTCEPPVVIIVKK